MAVREQLAELAELGFDLSVLTFMNFQELDDLKLFVDEVLQVYRLAESEIEHAAAALGGEVAPYISGIARPVHQMGPGPSTSKQTGPSSEASVIILLDLRAVLSA